MFGDISKAEKIYIACGYTDMRKSIDGFAAFVQQNFQLNPFQNSLFLFCGRRHDRLKALYWESDGFVLLYKRLRKGKFQMANECRSSPLYNLPGVPVAYGRRVSMHAQHPIRIFEYQPGRNGRYRRNS